jgi:hypothetical protein
MRRVPTITLLIIVALLAACSATGGASRTPSATRSPAASASPTPSNSGDAAASEPEATGPPETVTVDELVADPGAYEGHDVVLTAAAVKEVAASAWLVGPDPSSTSTILMLDNDLHPVVINAGDTFEIQGRIEKFTDPESMTKEVGGLPDMYSAALTTYEGQYVLVASDLTTSGA